MVTENIITLLLWCYFTVESISTKYVTFMFKFDIILGNN